MAKTQRLTPAQIKALAQLDESFARPPDASVAVVAQEARELVATIKKYGKQLHAKTDLDAKQSGALGARLAVLEGADVGWAAVRDAATPADTKKGRSEAEKLKRDMVAALRYFARDEAGVQGRVDAIQEGKGIADLIDDLQKLADLVEENAALLRKAELPKRAPQVARTLARAIGERAAERPVERVAVRDGADPLATRNRAYWHLREGMDAVREAGRYLFREEPKKLALFRASTRHGAVRRKQPAPVVAPPPAG